MKLIIGALVAAAALAATAAGVARADVPPLAPGLAWCGENADAACQASMLYIECSDGSIWLVDPALADADSFGASMCDGDYAVLQAPATMPQLGDDDTPVPVTTIAGGTDVGLGADPNSAPDPTQYATEVQCPDGSIWAVAIGDTFVCPAA